MRASDSKIYNTDCLTEEGINLLLLLFPIKKKLAIQEWINGKNNPLDEQSKLRAYELFDSDINSRELFMKGIDYSYYCEEVE